MDENFLLTLEVLKYSPEVRAGACVHGVLALKNTSSGTYLAVSEAQRLTLEVFRTPQTVPNMLGRAILNRTCLELSEFYELILKAHRAGILIGDSKPAFTPAPKPSPGWPRLPSQVSIAVAAISGMGFLAAIAFSPVTLPTQILDLLIGWVVWGASLSLGFLAGAATLHHAGGRFPPPEMMSVRPVPHLHVDLCDSVLQPVSVRSAIELACMAPLLASAALACAFKQPWALFPVAGAIIALNPWLGPMARWRALWSKHPWIDTDRDFIFSTNRQPRRRIRAFRRHLDGEALAILLSMSLLWLAVAAHVLFNAIALPWLDLLDNASVWERAGIVSGAIVAVFVVGALIWIASTFSKRRGTRLIRNAIRQSRRWKVHPSGRLAQAEIMKAMSRSPLFRSVGMQKQLEVSRRFQLKRFKPWRSLSDSGEPATVGLIVRGTASVVRYDGRGRAGRTRFISEGDMFGVHGFVDPAENRMEMRSRTPLLALTLPGKFFQERIVQHLGVIRIMGLTEICSLLRSLPLCSGWQLASVMRLADIARMRTFEAGERIVRYGEDPRTFHIVWEGSVQKALQGRILEQLEEGDAFGETELLQNSAATTDAIAATPTRCLCVSRVDFIRFVTHNHKVALSFEARSSRRLGRPIFPLQASFDIR
ncbi:MAG: cyclic nucleotide-binding domain-containing protein [Opitutaceae bacterium]|nr:cyclic nucleotide-binding domain-containing protein [Opitutaceae bacterium]